MWHKSTESNGYYTCTAIPCKIFIIITEGRKFPECIASPKVIKGMSCRAILMYAKLVTHNKGAKRVQYMQSNACKLRTGTDEGMAKINTQLIFKLTNK